MLKRLFFLGFLLLSVGGSGNLAAQTGGGKAAEGVIRVKLQREVADRLAALPASVLTDQAQSTGVTPLGPRQPESKGSPHDKVDSLLPEV